MSIKGSCLCGAVTYEVTAPFQIIGNCHYSMYRLYARHGYAETRRHPVVPHPLIRHTGDALLMVKRLQSPGDVV